MPCFFSPSPAILWFEGWLFSLWFIVLSYATIPYLYRKDPALLE